MQTSGHNISYTMPPCVYRTFDPSAKWLWLDPAQYPDHVRAPETFFVSWQDGFTAVEFLRQLCLPGHAVRADICIFADTKYRLTVNGHIIGAGPTAAGGDYDNTAAMPVQYYDTYTLPLDGSMLDIRVEVQTPGMVMTDYSCGRGGFIFSCEIAFSDRTPMVLVSDESWLVRMDTAVRAIGRRGTHVFDFTAAPADWEPAYVLGGEEIVWNLAFADIPALAREYIRPKTIQMSDDGRVLHASFERIYSGYIALKMDVTERCTLRIYAGEEGCNLSGEPVEIITVDQPREYFGLRMRSIGDIAVVCDADAAVEIGLVYTHYPYDSENLGSFECSDAMLNQIYEVGRFTLEMCRQTLHLDSPLHQETLGCTGDYAIESLMTMMTYGDLRLTRLDIIRTADFLKMSGGFMFHTTYSLIWVQMLRDYYMATADATLVKQMLPVMELLFERFAGYMGERGVLTNPPSFMFVDWGELDGSSMHHPPMALGQTTLNAFFYKALRDGAELYALCGEETAAARCRDAADKLRRSMLDCFWDEPLGLFCDGFAASKADNTPTRWLPANIDRRYHTRHVNTLAVLYGLIEGDAARELMRRVVTEESLDGGTVFDIQPYFMHYVLEAVRRTGLFGEYGLQLLHLWDRQVTESPRGMKEGWGAFIGDRSHAWGATPTYQLPMALSGFEMLEPGFGAFRLNPQLFGLAFAVVKIPTPWGVIRIDQRSGNQAQIDVPGVFHRDAGGIWRRSC